MFVFIEIWIEEEAQKMLCMNDGCYIQQFLTVFSCFVTYKVVIFFYIP